MLLILTENVTVCIDKGYGIASIATRISVVQEGYDIRVIHSSVTIHIFEEFHVLVACMTRRGKAFIFCDACFQRPSSVRGSDEEGVDAS